MDHKPIEINWQVPDWHPDFGDARAECEHLQRLAVAVLSKIPRSKVELIVPEPGLMIVQIVKPDGIIAEVYSVDGSKEPEGRRYGLFLSPGTPQEKELYASSVSQAVGFLTAETGSSSQQSARARGVSTDENGVASAVTEPVLNHPRDERSPA
jgi:hypothetical protein